MTFHIGICELLSRSVYLGGDSSFIMGIVFMIIYALAFIGFNIYSFIDRIPTGWIGILERLLVCKTISKVINENIILYPNLKIKVIAYHQESREVVEKY